MNLDTAAKAFGILSLTALAACGGGGATGSNPVTGGTVDTVVDPTNPNTTAGQKFAFDQTIGLVANSIEFVENTAGDPTDDQLVINNVPFDTETGIYNRTGALPNGWSLYENDELGQPGRLDYYAVFNRSATGDVEGGTVASPNWTGSQGNAGAVVRRSSTPVNLPVTGIIQYNGSYGGIRELDNDTVPGPGVELVTGNASVRIDFDDFDITGDIVGFISNRLVYDITDLANPVGSLSDVTLAEAFINRPENAIDESEARSLDGTLAGNWTGVFGGPTGNEIAAYVILNGTTPATPNPGGTPIPGVGVRELGVLLVAQ